MPLPPLARRNSGFALATAASKSFSVPGLTSIWAISVIMIGAPPLALLALLAHPDKKKKAPSGACPYTLFASVLAQQEHRPEHHHRTARKHHDRPASVWGIIATLGAALGDDGRLIFFGGRKHAGK